MYVIGQRHGIGAIPPPSQAEEARQTPVQPAMPPPDFLVDEAELSLVTDVLKLAFAIVDELN
jgi:hypothetical protein